MSGPVVLRRDDIVPAPVRRRTRPADRRAQILAAAAELFAEFGFEATSVRQIAERVHILPGSLYHHFAAKDDMLHAILREPVARIAAANRALLERDDDAEGKLIASVTQRFREGVANWEVNAILLKDSALFRSRPDFDYVLDMKTASFRVQEAILVEGIRAGQFRADIDVYMMIGTISRMLSSAGDWFRTNTFVHSENRAEYTLDRVVNFHVDCVLRLVRAAGRLDAPVSLNLVRRVAS